MITFTTEADSTSLYACALYVFSHVSHINHYSCPQSVNLPPTLWSYVLELSLFFIATVLSFKIFLSIFMFL